MMPFRFAFASASLLLLAVAGGCARQDPYTIEVTAASLAASASGQAEVRFVPGAGFKWNEEFPATVKIVNPGKAQLARRAFTRAEGDFTSREGTGVLRLDVTAGAPGTTSIEATADFSVCNDDECRIFRAVPIAIPVQVQ